MNEFDPGATGPVAPILVADDDPEVRRIIRWALEDEGFAVETAADGQQALDRAACRRPALLVLDMTLPILDGYQVADALRASAGPAIPILMITADGSPVGKARRVGAYGYLKKPFDVDELIAAIRRGLSP